MSDKKTNKFKTPFKRKPISDEISETKHQKKDKPEVKTSVVRKGLKTKVKPLKRITDNTTEDKLIPVEDTAEDVFNEDTQQIQTNVLNTVENNGTKSGDFVFIFGNGEERHITAESRQQMSKKFGKTELLSDGHKSDQEDNQLVPEVAISDEQMLRDILENDEFIAEFNDDF